jgi:adenylyltransferase/sulfurtransferase
MILSDPESIPLASDITFICRRGNDSLLAAARLRDSLEDRGLKANVRDVTGGLVAWSRDVDPEFPVY